MIEIKDLYFSYHNQDEKRTILKGINLTIREGESIALMGSNGSGKSTLARCLNGLLLPESGVITVKGMLTTDESKLLEIRKHVGMVFQNPDNQLVSATVEREIAFGMENLGIPHDEMHRVVDEKLKEFDLLEYRTHSPHYMSGGEKQRLALAAVLAMQPQYLVFDEPTSLLDPQNRQSIINIIHQLSIRTVDPLTTILITQFPEEALVFDRLIVMHKGQIVMDDTPDAIFKQTTKLLEIGLEPPVSYIIDQIYQ